MRNTPKHHFPPFSSLLSVSISIHSSAISCPAIDVPMSPVYKMTSVNKMAVLRTQKRCHRSHFGPIHWFPWEKYWRITQERWKHRKILPAFEAMTNEIQTLHLSFEAPTWDFVYRSMGAWVYMVLQSVNACRYVCLCMCIHVGACTWTIQPPNIPQFSGVRSGKVTIVLSCTVYRENDRETGRYEKTPPPSTERACPHCTYTLGDHSIIIDSPPLPPPPVCPFSSLSFAHSYGRPPTYTCKIRYTIRSIRIVQQP